MALLRLDCPHCPTDQVAFDIVWTAMAGGRLTHWYVTALCGACGAPVSAKLRHNELNNTMPPNNYNSSLNEIFELLHVWPRRSIAAAPPHTPEAVTRRFLEGEQAYRRHSWNAAVAMYRSALDIATKAVEGIPKGTFFKRLEWLHDNHRITPDMKAWADHVRIEGNEALHDPEDFTEVDATPLRLFTEMFLRYVFELPGEVRAFRGETA